MGLTKFLPFLASSYYPPDLCNPYHIPVPFFKEIGNRIKKLIWKPKDLTHIAKIILRKENKEASHFLI
jgi:hypothetical protein